MTDPAFIESILQRGRQAKEKARFEFSNISPGQLNWKPSQQSWSIAECLGHLIASHNSYFPTLKNISEGTFRMNFWEKYSPFTAACGRMLKDQMQEQVKKKLVAPKKIRPVTGEVTIDFLDVYDKNLTSFLEYIFSCRGVDLDKTIITSPIMQIVTYTLRDALSFLVEHEHRHINQAIRVKSSENFPDC